MILSTISLRLRLILQNVWRRVVDVSINISPLGVLIGGKSHLSITQITKNVCFSLFLINSWLALPWQPLKLPKLHMNELPQLRDSIWHHICYDLRLIWKNDKLAYKKVPKSPKNADFTINAPPAVCKKWIFRFSTKFRSRNYPQTFRPQTVSCCLLFT